MTPSTVLNLPVVQVEIVNGKPAVTSLQVAEAFGKRHGAVLRDIDDLLSQVSEIFGKNEFVFNERDVPAGFGGTRKQRYALLSKDGFTILAMGYTGQRVMRLKEAYIQKFNEMEETIKMNVLALPNFADPVAAARAWADALEQKRETEQQLALAAPKAEVYDAVVADKEITLYQIARKLTGTNCVGIKKDLMDLGYLYKTKYQSYRVYSEYRGKLFDEKLIGGKNDIIVLDAGKKELARLYKQGLLSERKGHGSPRHA